MRLSPMTWLDLFMNIFVAFNYKCITFYVMATTSHTFRSLLQPRSFQERPRKRARTSGPGSNGGAIIESMHHHGKGVYSGTFSGEFCPAPKLELGPNWQLVRHTTKV